MSASDPLAGLCAYLLWVGGGGRTDWQITVRRTLEFMLALVQTGPLPSEESCQGVPRAVRDADAHLNQRWSRLPLPRVGVAELAAAAHISLGYLNRLFREIFGLSASVALEHLRCFRAEVLLTRTDPTIAAIAHQCGYADVTHFSHRFGDLYGIPPSRHRMVPNQSPSVLDEPGVPRLSRLVWD